MRSPRPQSDPQQLLRVLPTLPRPSEPGLGLGWCLTLIFSPLTSSSSLCIRFLNVSAQSLPPFLPISLLGMGWVTSGWRSQFCSEQTSNTLGD